MTLNVNREEYYVSRDHRLTLAEYIDRCEFETIDPKIETLRFRVPDLGNFEKYLELFIDYPNSLISSEEFEGRLDKNVAGDVFDLMSLCAAFRDLGTQTFIVALKTRIWVSETDSWVFVVGPTGGGGRALRLASYQTPWNAICGFITCPSLRR